MDWFGWAAETLGGQSPLSDEIAEAIRGEGLERFEVGQEYTWKRPFEPTQVKLLRINVFFSNPNPNLEGVWVSPASYPKYPLDEWGEKTDPALVVEVYVVVGGKYYTTELRNLI